MSAPTSPKYTAHDAVIKWLVQERVIYMWASGDISPSVREWMNTQAVYLYHSCGTPKIHLFIDTRQVSSQSPANRQARPATPGRHPGMAQPDLCGHPRPAVGDEYGAGQRPSG